MLQGRNAPCGAVDTEYTDSAMDTDFSSIARETGQEYIQRFCAVRRIRRAAWKLEGTRIG
ncbi:MAG: hypothetical protein N2C12_06210 [Planctomycetales bacterium]